MTVIPKNYKSCLDYRQTERAIKFIKDTFERNLSGRLKLERISAPLFVFEGEGLNDDLSGREMPVGFEMSACKGRQVQIVHSLAKWKRLSLRQYDFGIGEGLYTDMNAIRPCEELDNIHSIYVDQWDWERSISTDERNTAYLYEVVRAIVGVVSDTAKELKERFEGITVDLSREPYFITSQELEDLYPNLEQKEREKRIAKKHGVVFISQIGGALKSGKPHDNRAPDYDDWNLNGDIIYWNDVLCEPFEISSMGIRVTPEVLRQQLSISGATDREKLKYHSMLLNNALPNSIGGGIGQSRLCMLLLEKAHIGEVHASVWDEETHRICNENGVRLL